MVVQILEAQFAGNTDQAASHVELQWQGLPATIIPTDHSEQRRRLLTQPDAQPTQGLVADAVNVLQPLLQPLLNINKDKVLQVDIEAEYNKVIEPFKKAPIKITKESLLERVCSPPVVTPSRRFPTRCVGPAAILNLVPAECTISYTPANKTRTYRCQAPRLVLVKNPAFCNKQYKSAATFRGRCLLLLLVVGVVVALPCRCLHTTRPMHTGPLCVFRKELGNVTTLTLNGGVVRYDLKDAKDALTANALRALSSFVGVEDDKGIGGSILEGLRTQLGDLVPIPLLGGLLGKDGVLPAFLSSLSTAAVRALLGEALEKGQSIAAAVLGRALSG